MTAIRTTRAYLLESVGYDHLVERSRTVASPGANQVMVRMKAASLNFRDLKILKGVYTLKNKFPVVPLSDGAGEIVETGSAVTRFRTGDRVMPIYMEGWHSGPMLPSRDGWRAKAADVDGTATEIAVYDEADVLMIPPSLSYEEVACLPCAGTTAWHALVYLGHIKPGDDVLIQGSGGVSLFGLQIARIAGARVIALSGDDTKMARLVAMGASAGINYRQVPEWGDRVRDLTGGRGVDHVLEVGGSATIAQSIRATKTGGQISVVGNLSGHFASTALAERAIAMPEIAVGSREMSEDLMRAIDLHGVKPIIDRRFAFADLKKALAYLEEGQHFGKVVITF